MSLLGVILGRWGLVTLIALGVWLWYAYYRSFVFHQVLAVSMPAFVAAWLGTRVGAPFDPAVRGWEGGLSVAGILTALLGLALTVLAFALIQWTLFENRFAVEGRFGPHRWVQLLRISEPTSILIASFGLYFVGVAALTTSAVADQVTLDASGAPWGVIGRRGLAIAALDVVKVGAAAVALALVWWLLFRRSWGLRIRAYCSNAAAASAVGIAPGCVSAFIVPLGAAYVGLAGLLIALGSNVRAEVGFTWLLLAASVVVYVGPELVLRSIFWIPVGAAAVSCVYEVFQRYGSGEWGDAVAVGMLLCVVVLKGKHGTPGWTPARR